MSNCFLITWFSLHVFMASVHTLCSYVCVSLFFGGLNKMSFHTYEQVVFPHTYFHSFSFFLSYPVFRPLLRGGRGAAPSSPGHRVGSGGREGGPVGAARGGSGRAVRDPLASRAVGSGHNIPWLAFNRQLHLKAHCVRLCIRRNALAVIAHALFKPEVLAAIPKARPHRHTCG
jgi:hypothetical protein